MKRREGWDTGTHYLTDDLDQGFSTRGPWPPGGPRRHCRGSATWAYVDQFTIDFFYFYKYTWARRHIYVWIAKSHCPKYWCRPIFSEEITLTSIIGRICVRGEGAWRRRWLQTWKRRVRDCKMFWESLAHQWAADYFLVRMVVPGTKPVENPCSSCPLSVWNRRKLKYQQPFADCIFNMLTLLLHGCSDSLKKEIQGKTFGEEIQGHTFNSIRPLYINNYASQYAKACHKSLHKYPQTFSRRGNNCGSSWVRWGG